MPHLTLPGNQAAIRETFDTLQIPTFGVPEKECWLVRGLGGEPQFSHRSRLLNSAPECIS